jgi:hypothetical protein
MNDWPKINILFCFGLLGDSLLMIYWIYLFGE